MAKKSVPACVLLVPILAFGQTRLDLNLQGKNVDFSNMPLVRPFRMGSVLPATCTIGEMFFNTTTAPGANTYGCVAQNTWASQGQGGGSGAPVPVQIMRTSNTVLTIGADCTLGTPCKVRNGSIVHTIVSQATATIQSGAGLANIYLSSNGDITVGTPAGFTGFTCAGCQAAPLVTQFPLDSIPLATWSATSNTWDPTGTDMRAVLSAGRSFAAGPNVTLTQAGNNVTISATAYNPADMTAFDRAHVFSEFGYNASAPWASLGTCVAAQGNTGVAGEPGSLGWTSTSNPCFVYYPGGNGGSFPFRDFLSGASPNSYLLVGRYGRGNASGLGSGDHYIGWSAANNGTVATFVGARYLASAGQWQCVIRAGGSDVVAQTIGVAADAAPHTFSITNGGTANSVTCQVDAISLTVTGSIPATTWFAAMGSTIASGSSFFTTIEARIHIARIAR